MGHWREKGLTYFVKAAAAKFAGGAISIYIGISFF